MISYFSKHQQPVEADIDTNEFRGWFGEKWKRTQENAARIATRLKDKCSQDDIVTQLNAAISSIHKYQLLSGAVFASVFAAPYIAWQSGYFNPSDDVQRAKVFLLALFPGAASVVNILRLDARKYFYREIIQSLENMF